MSSALDTEKGRRKNKGAFRFVKVTTACSELPGGSTGSRNRRVFSSEVPESWRRHASQYGEMAPGTSQLSYQDSSHNQSSGSSLRVLHRDFARPVSRSPGLLLKPKISWAKPESAVARKRTRDFKLLLQAKPAPTATLGPSKVTTK